MGTSLAPICANPFMDRLRPGPFQGIILNLSHGRDLFISL